MNEYDFNEGTGVCFQLQPIAWHNSPEYQGPAEGSQGSGGHVPGVGEHGQQFIQQHRARDVGQTGMFSLIWAK